MKSVYIHKNGTQDLSNDIKQGSKKSLRLQKSLDRQIN